jgi:high affinity Mn2+ porin
VQELRVGLNYRFGEEAASSANDPAAPAALDPGKVNFHAQATFVEQGYPSIRSPYEGPNSLPGGGEGRETIDLCVRKALLCDPWVSALRNLGNFALKATVL